MSLFTEIANTRYGRMMFNKNDVYIGQALQYYGEYSEWESQAFRELLCPGDWVVEAGANIGALTVPIAQHVGNSGQVFAIEPQRMNYLMLCGNVGLNSLLNVQCFNVACGAEPGEIGLPDWNPHYLCNAGGMPLGAGECSRKVQVITIDSLNLPRCDFIKADVEGMEAEVLQGAFVTINQFRPLLYVEDDREKKREALHCTIRQFGYRMYRHNTPLYNPTNYLTNPKNLYPGIASFNLLCVPKERTEVDISGLEEVA